MHFYPNERLALFIDGANLYATAKALGFDIDYKRLLALFRSKGQLVRALYYTALAEDQEYSSIRPLVDWLDYNGYTMVTKPTKEFTDALGRRKIKGNMDIELTVDAMRLVEHLDHVVLFTGDGDFRALVGGHAAARPARQRRVDAADPAADGGRRVAPAGRPVRRPGRPRRADLPRSGDPPGARAWHPARCAAAPVARARDDPRLPATRTTSSPPEVERTLALDELRMTGRAQVPAEAPRDCPLCPRLVAFRAANRQAEPSWYNGAVASFGKNSARLLIVGLAPGLKGANRTGRPFTGDYAGDLLYATLLELGFARGHLHGRARRRAARSSTA